MGGLGCLELLLWTTPLWRARKLLAGGLVLVLSVISGVLLAQRLNGWLVIICIISFYRLINLLRVVKGRSQADHIYHSSRRTAVWLIGAQVVVVLLAKFGAHYHIESLTWFYSLALGQLLGSFIIYCTVQKHLKITVPPVITDSLATRDLPTLTVAVPARNETADLEACLQSLIASTYPKLEILVLDDCSQNKHTPEIIRSFAHDGVRFVAGKIPPANWLAKNYAYSQLADEANGELLLFCGVDARFEPESLQNIVRALLYKQKSMLSILPHNALPADGALRRLLAQPSRYAWELALPRQMIGRPPVLSTCWLISRVALEAAGGFKAVTRKVVPESYFAKYAAGANDAYSFLQSDNNMRVASHKSIQEQCDTAVRTRYPQMHRRLELVALYGLLQFALLVWPFIILAVSLVSSNWTLVLLTLATCLFSIAWYSRIVNLTYRSYSLAGLFLLPIAALYDLGVLNYSMWQYEFSQVIWKGRNVCIPVMRVIPYLEKL